MEVNYPEDYMSGVKMNRRTDPNQLNNIDWKKRMSELSVKNWDEEKQFTGMSRLGDSFHPLDPFFKFDPPDPATHWTDHLWYPTYGAIGCVVSVLLANLMTRRPMISRMPFTFGLGILGLGLGELSWRYRTMKSNDRDAVLVHYMMLHEDDFPRIPRRKFKDMMIQWYPFRMR